MDSTPTLKPLRPWLLAGLVAWAGAGLLVELNSTLTAYDQRGTRREVAGLWRFGLREPARLAACLDAVDRRIPPGSTVSILSRPGSGDSEFYAWRWAAYLLPLHDVLPETAMRGATPRDFVVGFQRRFEPAEPAQRAENSGMEAIPIFPGCELYRVVRP